MKNSKISQKISKISLFFPKTLYFTQNSVQPYLIRIFCFHPKVPANSFKNKGMGLPPPHRANVTYIILKNSTKKAVLSVKFSFNPAAKSGTAKATSLKGTLGDRLSFISLQEF